MRGGGRCDISLLVVRADTGNQRSSIGVIGVCVIDRAVAVNECVGSKEGMEG